MNKNSLKNIIQDQKEMIEQKLGQPNIIQRFGKESCLPYIKYPNVLLVSGLRRAGKSIFSHLLLSNVSYSYINFDDERLFDASTKDLNTILECFYDLNGTFDTILLDEIQNIKGWELFVNRLREKYKIIITGSNAHLLSHELATHLTGRYSLFTLYPLSFREFLNFRSFELNKNSYHSTKIRAKIHGLFDDYLFSGGIFEYYTFGKEFLRNLFTSIITKDIVLRYKIKYPIVLEELALQLINYFSSKISISNLTKNLNLKSPHTTLKYIKYLENSFLFFLLPKFSYKIKEQLSSFKKLYVIDNGLINSLSFSFMENKGRFLENLVAIELKRMTTESGQELFYWDNYNHECDFIVKRGNKIKQAIQVCYELTAQNKDREIKGLVAAMHEFKLNEGLILTNHEEDSIKTNNKIITILPVAKWILEKDF